ncbi:MAG: hypothetical protein BRD30_01850 [Bacteroidetes bacterium QH_2_63_10]|nr:MAG: hypothetical protein BRD30_01850 [Bacteroidetes bacterium QH_2_63_10]
MRNQIRRATISVMSTIAEGVESRTQARFVDFSDESRPLWERCVFDFSWPEIKSI